MFGTILGELFCGVGLPLGVTLYDDESCGGDGGSRASPKVKKHGAGTRG